ncbi:MAG TPA: type II toxin-antitoxin system VapC family toxin [Hanamia sp.]|nr:type II toxin-antitoxin system VapC family toxin [Hanamia sp.]
MNGNRFLLDTNIILYILSGDKIIANYLRNKILYTSIICEIELLSYKSISLNEEKGIQKFLSEFRIISIDQSIKELSIQLRKKYFLKIPDTIIAATSISLGIPLVTADKVFKQISELTIDLYNK